MSNYKEEEEENLQDYFREEDNWEGEKVNGLMEGENDDGNEDDIDFGESEESEELVGEVVDTEGDTEGVDLAELLGGGDFEEEDKGVYYGDRSTGKELKVEDYSGSEEEESGELEEEEGEEPEDTASRTKELRRLTEEFKERAEQVDIQSTVDFSLIGREGDYISTRVNSGETYLKVLNIETDIKTPRRVRTSPQNLYNLQEQMRKFGQLQPIHVVEWGDYYLLVDGMRRIQTSINLGKTEILAYVDGTVPEELVKYYEAIVNSREPYLFSEMLEYGQRFFSEQPNIGYDVIEGILGLASGEFLKGLYIDTMKTDFMDTYMQVEKGKLPIDQAFKKIEKEIEKREKEEAKGEDELQSEDMDHLKNTNDLTGMNSEAQTQELGNRRILDPVLRRSVESRDGGNCQCCGFGKGEPDLMGAFNVHHIVAVQYGGADKQSNLILLCSNCHTLVHDYEKGRFMPEKSTYTRLSWVKRVIVLGNMLLNLKQIAIADIRRKHPDTARVMDAGKTTVGKAVDKHGIDLKGEELYGGSPYQTFMDSTRDLDYGGEVKGELGEVSWADEDEELDRDEVEELPVNDEDVDYDKNGDEVVYIEGERVVKDGEYYDELEDRGKEEF